MHRTFFQISGKGKPVYWKLEGRRKVNRAYTCTGNSPKRSNHTLILPQYPRHVRKRGTVIYKSWIRSKGPCCSRLTGLIVSAWDSHGVQSLCRDTEVTTGVFRKVWRYRTRIGQYPNNVHPPHSLFCSSISDG